MKFAYDMDMDHFEAWSGAVSTLDRIREEGKVDALESLIETLWGDREYVDEVEINDWLWFEWESIFEALGIRDEDEDEDEGSIDGTEEE